MDKSECKINKELGNEGIKWWCMLIKKKKLRKGKGWNDER